jgi:hypothetical protein
VLTPKQISRRPVLGKRPDYSLEFSNVTVKSVSLLAVTEGVPPHAARAEGLANRALAIRAGRKLVKAEIWG